MDVLSLGIFVVDVIGRPVDNFPEEGGLEVFDELEIHAGGGANNTGIGLAKLGIDVGAAGRIGQDAFGDLVLDTLKTHNIDTGGIVRDETTKTSVTFVAVASDGERSFLHHIGANGAFSETDVNMDMLKTCKILHVAGTFVMPELDGQPTARLLEQAQKAGVTTSLDPAWDATGRWLKTLEPCLPHVDIFLPSIKEAEQLTGLNSPPKIAEFLMNYGIQTIGLKMGKRGSYVRTVDAELYIPAFQVDVVDTTGSGDAYAAGFLAGTIKEWDLERTAQLAAATGAACATAMGTTAGIQNLEKTLAIIKG